MTISKKKKKKEGRLVRKITRPQLADPTYKKVQSRKKGKTFTPTELKELRKLAKAHDEEAGYDLASISAELPSKPVMKKKVDPQELKTRLEKQRKKAEAVEDLAPEKTRGIKKLEMVKATYIKDGKRVEELIVKGDPKLKEISLIKRAEIRPLTEQEMARIRETGVKQRQILMEEAQLYQDKLKAQKFLASAFKGKIKPFPKKGYSTYKIVAAYRKRKPTWRLRIRRDHHRDEVHMKFVCTNDYLRGREEVHKEVQKVLVLMNMRMTPDATIRDVTPPRVGPKYRWVHIAVKARKIGEGEIRPRII